MNDCSGHDFELFRISRGEWAPMLGARLHILVCPSCRARVAELRNVATVLTSSMGGGQPLVSRISGPVAATIIICGIFATGSLIYRFKGSEPVAASATATAVRCVLESQPKALPVMATHGANSVKTEEKNERKATPMRNPGQPKIDEMHL